MMRPHLRPHPRQHGVRYGDDETTMLSEEPVQSSGRCRTPG